MQRSIQFWISQAVDGITPAIKLWAERYPLPIGEESARRLYAERGQSYPDELTGSLPFKGAQEAYWALRVEKNRSVLDMFGLSGPKGWVLPGHDAGEYLSFGRLAYSLHGYDDTSLVELVQDAVTWWHNFSWEKIQGRPRGSTAWGSAEEFENSVREAVRKLSAQQEKVTQAKVAAEMGYRVRTVRRAAKRYGGATSWREFLKRL
jgi:hypothetical protein